MTDSEGITETPQRMRRISITVEIEIPESEFADLAEEALATGRDLRQLVAARYGSMRRSRTVRSASSTEPKINVSDYKHLYNQAPAGQQPYRGSGRPPKWLLDRIKQEIGVA